MNVSVSLGYIESINPLRVSLVWYLKAQGVFFRCIISTSLVPADCVERIVRAFTIGLCNNFHVGVRYYNFAYAAAQCSRNSSNLIRQLHFISHSALCKGFTIVVGNAFL